MGCSQQEVGSNRPTVEDGLQQASNRMHLAESSRKFNARGWQLEAGNRKLAEQGRQQKARGRKSSTHGILLSPRLFFAVWIQIVGTRSLCLRLMKWLNWGRHLWNNLVFDKSGKFWDPRTRYWHMTYGNRTDKKWPNIKTKFFVSIEVSTCSGCCCGVLRLCDVCKGGLRGLNDTKIHQ